MARPDQRCSPEGQNGLSGTLPKQAPPIRVLAVDDEPAARKLVSLFLGPPAFHCVTAGTGEEALACLLREPFDAIISDLQMPGMSGMDLLAETRRRLLHVAFLVTTGVDDIDVGVEAMRSGADDYLVKPLSEKVMVASLERALQKQKLERELADYRQHLEEMVAERTHQLTRALAQLGGSYEETLQALGAAIDLRDNETAGHSQRVCQYSVEIARAMSLTQKETESLARGAYLHDIGKLGVPDAVLLKPGPLTAGERAIMQRHVQVGFNLVKGISFLSDAAEIVLTHHERYDGSGYPQGLRKQEILLPARIFAVADSFDAITSDRPYRRASSFEEGWDTIRREAGRLFDPQVVNVFLSTPTHAWQKIARRSTPSSLLAGN